ncbi:hypothetical protein GALMADRAFT_220242 [Galerina marginata CBS 339.88]|uniref:Uncharacterized protein n=1 Tax=Galerina marginata (strain CBS 339.88) TaxID=685588 RepID=A0A067TMZ5_GALM3|nr:hypothetical protein GALMADRAFT_220242 [Galerina marginata CBS 339.88]
MQTVKLVLMGDIGVGKTCLLIAYTSNRFPDYAPTVFGSYVETNVVDGKSVNLQLWDNTARTENDRLRPLAYPGTDIFVICFSIANPSSYESVRTKWYPEKIHYGPSSAAVIVVGLKSDLRDDPETRERLRNCRTAPISYQQGIAMCKDIGAAMYFECSARTGLGLRAVFEEAMRVVVNSPPRKEKGGGKCIIT